MAKLNIERLQPGEFPAWDRYVYDHPEGTVFHTTEWLGCLAGDPVVLVARDGSGGIRGGAALMISRRYGTSGYHIPPYTPYYGPLFTPSARAVRGSAHSEDLALVQRLLVGLPKTQMYDFLLTPGFTDLLPYIWNGFQTTVRYTYLISGNVDEYRDNMVRRKANYLNRMLDMSDSGELQLSCSHSVEEVIEFFRHTAHARDIGLNETALRSLFTGWKVSDDSPVGWRLVSVEHRSGAHIAGTLLVYDRRRGYYLGGGVRRDAEGLLRQANLLCMDAMIRFCLESGRVFDFEGSIIPGVEKFFRHLGGRQIIRCRVQKSRSALYSILRALRAYARERKCMLTVE